MQNEIRKSLSVRAKEVGEDFIIDIAQTTKDVICKFYKENLEEMVYTIFTTGRLPKLKACEILESQSQE